MRKIIGLISTIAVIAFVLSIFTLGKYKNVSAKQDTLLANGSIRAKHLDPKLYKKLDAAIKVAGALPVDGDNERITSCDKGQLLSFQNQKFVCVTSDAKNINISDVKIGPAGAAGAVGPTGAVGATGAVGPTGATGPAGVLSTSFGDGLSGSLALQVLTVNIVTDTNGGITKTNSGLTLLTTCSTNEILKYNGSSWNCSNDNTGSVTTGDLTSSTSGISIVGGTGSVVGSGTTLNIATASGSSNGLLSSVNWTTFNNKENALTFTGNGLFSRTANAISSITCSTSDQLSYNGTSWVCLTPSPNLSVGNLDGQTGNAKGATISSNVLYLQSATDTQPGVINTSTQTFAGNKTFKGDGITSGDVASVLANNLTSGNGFKVVSSATSLTGNLANVSLTGDNAGNTGTLLSLNANGNANAVAGLKINVLGSGLALDVTGSMALRPGTNYTSTGTQNDVNFGPNSSYRLNPSAALTITGIANGVDGKLLTLMNTSTQSATLANQSSGSVAANRIITGNDIDLILNPNSSALLQYDTATSRWRVISTNTFTVKTGSSTLASNFTTGSSSYVDTGMSVTFPSAGTYVITYSVASYNSALSYTNYFRLAEGASRTHVTSSISIAQNYNSTFNAGVSTKTLVLTVSQPTTYYLQASTSKPTMTIESAHSPYLLYYSLN